MISDLLFKQIINKHEWKVEIGHHYSVKRLSGSVETEATLVGIKCVKCGREALLPEDRTHEINALGH